MATLPFVGPAIKHRKPLTGARLIIVASAALFAMFLIWASLAQVDEVTRGEGKVIPSSKLQVITASEPATVAEILVKSGQQVKGGQLLARLDSPESRQVQAETESLQARV
jgi:adhesin transport system membrane fusion protein